MFKFCNKCKQNKDVSSFYKDKNRKSGYRCYCKECEKKINSSNESKYKEKRKQYRQTENYLKLKRNYYKRNKETIDENNKNWSKNTLNGRFSAYKTGAKNRNIEWNLSFEDYNVKDHLNMNKNETNVYNEYQGNFRYAPLNIELLRYAIHSDSINNKSYNILSMTCMDQLKDINRIPCVINNKIEFLNTENISGYVNCNEYEFKGKE